MELFKKFESVIFRVLEKEEIQFEFLKDLFFKKFDFLISTILLEIMHIQGPYAEISLLISNRLFENSAFSKINLLVLTM